MWALSVVVDICCAWNYPIAVKICYIARSAVYAPSLVELDVLLDASRVTSLDISN